MNYGWLLGLLGDSSVASGSSDPGESMGFSYSGALKTPFVVALGRFFFLNFFSSWT